MNTFAAAAKASFTEAMTTTTNGMAARVSTASSLLDLFTVIGSSRTSDLTAKFLTAIAEDEDKALRILQWARDIRGGAGERKTFRSLLAALDKVSPATAARLMHKVPELGRWDDLFVYTSYENRQKALDMFCAALLHGNGLAAKWAPRKGPVAVELTKYLGITPKQYRRLVVDSTNVVEQKMCAKDWSSIDFSKLPSVASARYQNAFGRNAPKEYAAYLASLAKGETKINAGAVYPYDVVRSVRSGNTVAADAQWKALPNYIGDAKVFPLVDTSGSMGVQVSGSVTAMDVATSLGLYCAEKNTGPFKDLLMVWSGTAKIIHTSGPLSTRLRQIPSIVADTNLSVAFETLLKTALSGKALQEDMPDVLLIMSDMQFNQGVNYDETAVQMIRRKYEESGYKLPKVVFWNIAAKNLGNTPVRFDDRGIAMVSGFSPTILKTILSDKLENFTPETMMLETIMNERYDL
jgi:hypothetical protein